ncbi:uncharacterized protein MCYG_02841 [Microsporum canis CBS 113480]|uniref:Uncharacterized protein n=1 Tax=Arthroderma otae (strain ATCC MYA-4605 / CBS 113480) TaxID=554155 RepID=C5FK00_ARTOC|nr:uncharacterized protein MCYG_02841 [Microsporum canis CBS 113480]EEQ30022.1 predicted protein [Microsporum canis CBS 113480]
MPTLFQVYYIPDRESTLSEIFKADSILCNYWFAASYTRPNILNALLIHDDLATFLAIHTRWQVMHPTIVTRAGTDAQARPYRRSLRPDRKEETPAVIQGSGDQEVKRSTAVG